MMGAVGLVAVLLLQLPLCRARLPSASRSSSGSSDGAAAKLGDDPVPSRKKIVSLILDGHDFYEGEQLFLLQSTGRPGEYKAVRHAPSGRALEGISLDVTVIKSSVRNATEEQAEQQSPIVGGDEERGSDGEDDGFKKKVFSGVISLLCILCAATAAGLTLGMLSLDPLSLEIKRRASSDSAEREWSERLLPLLVGHSSRHRLLVSLLLLNSLANEALPIVRHDSLDQISDTSQRHSSLRSSWTSSSPLNTHRSLSRCASSCSSAKYCPARSSRGRIKFEWRLRWSRLPAS